MWSKFKLVTIPSLLALVLTACNSSNTIPEASAVADMSNTNNANTEVLPGEDYNTGAFEIVNAQVKYEPVLDAFLFSIETKENAASVAPVPAGQVNGAPVLGYAFVTDLSPEDIGYLDVEGTVALAITSHPDFDDTPLWDENNNNQYDDDGVVYHSHWVVLEQNELAGVGLAVVQTNEDSQLTPTSPMPMYLDSPGYDILEKDKTVTAVVPANAVKRRVDFTANALTAYLEVDATGGAPLLKVERFYTMPGNTLNVLQQDQLPSSNWPMMSVLSSENFGSDDSLQLTTSTVDYLEELDTLVFTMTTQGLIANKTVEPLGQVNGAPVLGYIFPTNLPTSAAGFNNIDNAILALAVTTHPDFDDTPLWDENLNNNYQDDGVVYHTHWVALVADDASGAGLSVPSSFEHADLPPTAPMPMYLDSPNFHAYAQDNILRVIVPVQRIGNITEFNFDGLTAAMNVDASGAGPVLRVNQVLSVQSGDLSLPYSVMPKLLTDLD